VITGLFAEQIIYFFVVAELIVYFRDSCVIRFLCHFVSFLSSTEPLKLISDQKVTIESFAF